MNISVSETNESITKEENYSVRLKGDIETKYPLSIRGKFKKTIQKRILPGQSGDGTKKVEEKAREDKITQGRRKAFQRDNDGRNPQMWLKIDPNWEFLKIISVVSDENVWLV